MTAADAPGVLVLVSEARGEFLMIERMRADLRELGVETVHVTPLASDVAPDEAARPGVVVLDRHPAYARAAGLAADGLRAALDREQRALGTNLRRAWQADWRSWREGAGDDAMARIALGYVWAWRDVIRDAWPVVAVWGEDGGHLAKQVPFLLRREWGIPQWFPWAMPLPGRALLFDNFLARFDRAEFDAFDPTAEEREYAERLIADVRSSTVQFTVPRDMTFRPRKVVNLARLLARRYVTRPPGAESLYPLTFALLYARQKTTATAIRRRYRGLGERPFFFYPLHAARDTQISVRAPQWEDQLALVEHLASSLPYGYELAIKEHPYEVGALPLGRLRALLRRWPAVRLLHPTLHAHTILPRAAALVTINSTAGFEALFFGKPVVTFGHSAYRGLGLTYDVEDPFDTPRLLVEAVAGGPPAPSEVVRYVAFLHRKSFPARPLSYDLGDENVRSYAELFAELARLAGGVPATA